ncbi:WHG domain-containing protein, partial [Stenotrophomonas maltophilia]|uniref:WHG domain-containing protein n=1 Tax=Stenotrophomonas maltophilia TaxID=40324 RepID=UPI0019548705
AMFNTGMAAEEATSTAEDPGFAMLRKAVGRALGIDDPETVRSAAILVFALTHGLAGLSAPGSVARPRDLVDAERMLDLGV